MAGIMKTPGVYIEESSAFPRSVVEVATAVAAFVGHTRTAMDGQRSLENVPRMITSMAEYRHLYGSGPDIEYALVTERPDGFHGEPAVTQGDAELFLERRSQPYNLYHSLSLFFRNGGRSCCIVSVGDYDTAPARSTMVAGIERLAEEPEPTLLLVPDAVLLASLAECIDVQKAAVAQCGRSRSRFAILDVHEGHKSRGDGEDCVAAFRNALGTDDLDYAAAYYPWLYTTLVQASELGHGNFDPEARATLQTLIAAELGLGATPEKPEAKRQAELLARLDGKSWSEEERADLATSEASLDESLIATSAIFARLLEQIGTRSGLLPPSGAMAGVYARVDESRGVWKAPANVKLEAVLEPAVDIAQGEQEDLNVSVSGKSINALRSFVGRGTLVWGARTLDGNSLEWRYIHARRTAIMLEQSIGSAIEAHVFEPNDVNTWVLVRSMIDNFLRRVWKRGGLAGSTPADAFGVHVGLGETMTTEDVLEGTLRVTVRVAIDRPAEFTELAFQQRMQTS